MGRGFGSYIRVGYKAALLKITECKYCGSKDKLAIDHIHPLNKGGNSEFSNLTRACNRCNGIKTDFMMDEFLERVIEKQGESYIKMNKEVEIFNKHHRAKSHPKKLIEINPR
jgi:hypothetical protein